MGMARRPVATRPRVRANRLARHLDRQEVLGRKALTRPASQVAQAVSVPREVPETERPRKPVALRPGEEAAVPEPGVRAAALLAVPAAVRQPVPELAQPVAARQPEERQLRVPPVPQSVSRWQQRIRLMRGSNRRQEQLKEPPNRALGKEANR